MSEPLIGVPAITARIGGAIEDLKEHQRYDREAEIWQDESLPAGQAAGQDLDKASEGMNHLHTKTTEVGGQTVDVITALDETITSLRGTLGKLAVLETSIQEANKLKSETRTYLGRARDAYPDFANGLAKVIPAAAGAKEKADSAHERLSAVQIGASSQGSADNMLTQVQTLCEWTGTYETAVNEASGRLDGNEVHRINKADGNLEEVALGVDKASHQSVGGVKLGLEMTLENLERKKASLATIKESITRDRDQITESQQEVATVQANTDGALTLLSREKETPRALSEMAGSAIVSGTTYIAIITSR